MKALEALSDAALFPLILATNYPEPNPFRRQAPRYAEYFANVVAVEVNRRPALRERFRLSGEVEAYEPPFPLELEAAELEMAAEALLAMAGHEARPGATADDVARGAALRQIAGDVMLILNERLRAARPGH